MVSVIVNIYQYYTNLTKCQGLLGYNYLHDIYVINVVALFILDIIEDMWYTYINLSICSAIFDHCHDDVLWCHEW